MYPSKTLLDLLYEGSDADEMVDLIEQGKVIINDRFSPADSVSACEIDKRRHKLARSFSPPEKRSTA